MIRRGQLYKAPKGDIVSKKPKDCLGIRVGCVNTLSPVPFFAFTQNLPQNHIMPPYFTVEKRGGKLDTIHLILGKTSKSSIEGYNLKYIVEKDKDGNGCRTTQQGVTD